MTSAARDHGQSGYHKNKSSIFFLIYRFNENKDWRVARSATQKCLYPFVHVHEDAQTLPSHYEQ